MKKTQIYFFLEELNNINISMLKKLKNISLIYRNYSKNNYLDRALQIKRFSKQFGHNLFIANDLQLAQKLNVNLYIPSFNKKLKYLNLNNQKKMKVIGSAHNYSEIQKKISQGCMGVFISSLYQTSSHINTRPLGFIRFSMLEKYFKSKLKVYALGGIGADKIQKVWQLSILGFALKSFLDKQQSHKKLNFLNLIAG